jgi:hypothetical protein
MRAKAVIRGFFTYPWAIHGIAAMVMAVGRLGNALRRVLVRHRRSFLPSLSLMCILAGVIIAVVGVREARVHNAVLRRLNCESETRELIAAGWKGKLLPCSEVKFPPDLQLVGDRDIWPPILLGGYVATFGVIVYVSMSPRGTRNGRDA